MKKAIILALVALLCFSLAACGGGAGTPSPALTPAKTSAPPNPTQNSPISEKIEIPSDGITIFDNDGIVITAQSVKRERKGYITGLELLIENNTDAEKNVCVWPDAAFGGPIIVNGYSMNSIFNETVAAGKKAKATLRFDEDTIELLCFENLYELTAPFGTYESRDDYMKHEITTYAPSVLTLGEFAASPVGELIYSEKDIEIYKCGFKKSTFSSDKAIFIIKNGSGEDRSLELDSVSINGFMLNAFLSESADIFDGTYSVVLLSLRYDDGDKYSEDNVEEIEFTLKSKGFNEIFSMNTETIGVVSITY